MFNPIDPREQEEYRRRIRREVESEYRYDGMGTVRFGIKLCLAVLLVILFMAVITNVRWDAVRRFIMVLDGCREVELPYGVTLTKCN